MTCRSGPGNLYSTECSIAHEFVRTRRLTYLSVYLRSIQAQKLISITTTITNGAQGTYALNASIEFNGFVYL